MTRATVIIQQLHRKLQKLALWRSRASSIPFARNTSLGLFSDVMVTECPTLVFLTVRALERGVSEEFFFSGVASLLAKVKALRIPAMWAGRKVLLGGMNDMQYTQIQTYS